MTRHYRTRSNLLYGHIIRRIVTFFTGHTRIIWRNPCVNPSWAELLMGLAIILWGLALYLAFSA
jgi:hypothetical protein